MVPATRVHVSAHHGAPPRPTTPHRYAQQPWYKRCSRFHVSYPEKVKSRFIANALSAYGKAWALEFSHIWSIDEDIIIPPMRYVAHFLHEAQRHGALIAQPAIIGSIWDLLKPHPRCRTRATDFVELMLPLLQLRVAIEVCMQVLSTGDVGMCVCSLGRPPPSPQVFSSLYRPEARTDWGVDVTWCACMRGCLLMTTDDH